MLDRRWRRVVAAPFFLAVAAILLAGLTPGVAQAHATYVRSEPQSGGKLATPGRITVYFTEDVDPGFSELQVLDATLRRVDRRDTQPVPDDRRVLSVGVPQLSDGTYTVSWRTLSAVDGHSVKGAFPLFVGEVGTSAPPTVLESPPDPFESLIRALIFLGTALLVGGALFGSVVMGPAQVALAADRNRIDLRAAWERRFRRFGFTVAGLLLLVHVFWLIRQVANIADVASIGAFGDPLLRYLGTRNGMIWLVKAIMLVLIVALQVLWPRPLLLAGTLVLGGVFMVGTSLTSHAAALNRGAELATAIDWLHQLAGAAWLGGLASALLLLPEIHHAPGSDRPALLGAVVPRLSAVATVSVIVLVATGVFGALIHVGSREAFTTQYGTALAVKILALAPMLLLGALNRVFFTPRFAAMAQRARAGAASALMLARRFRLIILGELTLGAIILLATGVLTSVEPAREVWAREPRPIDVTATTEGLNVRLVIEPGRVGENTYTVTVRDAAGAPAPDVQRVQLRFSYVDQALGRGTRIAVRTGADTYAVTGNDLSIGGRWQVDVAIRQLNREDDVAAFLVDVGVLTLPNGGSAFALPRFAAPYSPFALALLVAGLAAAVWGVLVPARRRTQSSVFASSVLLIMVSGVLLVPALDFSRETISLRNPVPVTAATLAKGQELYAVHNCATCHGETGRGDGPLGLGLSPRPADFRVHMAAGHTDGQLFDWVTNGVRGTAMRGYANELTELERWTLITYLRSFGAEEG
jgi:copper transport protein